MPSRKKKGSKKGGKRKTTQPETTVKPAAEEFKTAAAPPQKADTLIGNKDLKFVFVGGKGGVGKTTTSSAIAMQFAYDRKVLLLSTDPAHSLSDAFKMEFHGEPQEVPGIPNLSVMEVNPETSLQGEIQEWSDLAKASGHDEIITNVTEFQSWLSGVPGIDEATALANVISHIETGAYDTIVFDTAPTGHTLKLLALPKVLQVGLDKLQSWQSKIWGYWSAIKGAAGGNPQNMQDMVTEKLTKYKAGVEKIGAMLHMPQTNFVVVCIAEHLSINESRRLLAELKANDVNCSHIVVNQLVKDGLEDDEMDELTTILAKAQPNNNIVQKVMKSVQLTNARRNIQRKYLADLRASEEVVSAGLSLVEMPLLPSEITGAEALLGFSQQLMPEGFRNGGPPGELKNWKPCPTEIVLPQEEEVVEMDDEEEKVSLQVGDRVVIDGLVKAAQYNGLTGTITKPADENGRFSVQLLLDGKKKTLAMKETNLTKSEAEEAKEEASGDGDGGGGGGGGMFATVMADPEVVEALKNPKYKEAFDNVRANPMMFMQYMGDPELGPFIQKIMGKFGMGGMGGM